MTAKRANLLPPTAVLLLGVALAGCASAPPARLESLRLLADKTPVVLVPGVTGVALRDRDTGKRMWGHGGALLWPRDGGWAVALSIVEGAQDALEPAGVMQAVRVGPFRRQVYGPVAELLERHGYRRGDLERPRPGDTLFLFAYDWRRDNVISARHLAERLEALRVVRGEQRLAVDLICQSNGGHICRYLQKYGGATLEEAEAGAARRSRSLEVRKLVLVGTSNGGGLRILRELDRGRRYVPLVGRWWRPEVLFTFRALLQDLPVYRTDLFLDERGRPLAVDLFDAAAWRRYGWSIFGRRSAERVRRGARPDLFGDAEHRMDYLARELERARRLHAVLRHDVADPGATRYYLLQNAYRETPVRALLVPRPEGWETWFTGDREMRRLPALAPLLSAPGDGHASLESQMWLSPQERARIADDPFYVDEEHFRMILLPAAHQRLLHWLAEPGGAPSERSGGGAPAAPAGRHGRVGG